MGAQRGLKLSLSKVERGFCEKELAAILVADSGFIMAVVVKYL